MKEAAIVNQLPVYGVKNLRDVFGYFNEIISYHDSVKAATGILPTESSDLLIGSDSLSQFFLDRYYDKHFRTNGDAYYIEKNSGFSKNTEKAEAPKFKNGLMCTNNMCKLKDAEITTIIPNPVTTSTQITIICFKSVYAKIQCC